MYNFEVCVVVVRFPALGNGLFRCMGPGLPPRVAAVLDFWCAGVRSGWEWDGAVVSGVRRTRT